MKEPKEVAEALNMLPALEPGEMPDAEPEEESGPFVECYDCKAIISKTDAEYSSYNHTGYEHKYFCKRCDYNNMEDIARDIESERRAEILNEMYLYKYELPLTLESRDDLENNPFGGAEPMEDSDIYAGYGHSE